MQRWIGLAFALLLIPLLTPARTSAQSDRCFPETGQCINGAIRTYWEKNGGLSVFGYPVAPQANETIESWTGPVQWFERDRLEVHTEGVLAGRLGARKLEIEGRPWEGLPKVTSAGAGCQFFPETGHSLCAPLLTYWQKNGGLARFGLPLSEPSEETVGTWKGTVQWFERRRMEVHAELPNSPILLGLLGNEVRASTGATPPPSAPAEPTPAPSAPQPPQNAPITITGHGSKVTDPIQLPAALNRAIGTHSGQRNFIVWAHGAGDDKELLFNTIGSYSGIRPLVQEGMTTLEIKADGDWSITIEALPADQNVANGLDGRGDLATGLFTPTNLGNVAYAFHHEGERNIIVWLRCQGGDDLAVNDIGNYDGEGLIEFKQGPCYWDIRADGNWSLRPK